MKRYLTIIAMAAAVIATTYSCKKADPAKISDICSEMAYDASADSKTLTFTTNYPWTASTGANWITLGKTSGEAGKASISVSVSANGNTDRSAEIIITCLEAKATVRISQKQKNEISISESSKTVGSAEGDFTVTVKSNVTFSIEIPSSASWLSAETTKAMESTTVKFKCKENTTYDDRSANVVFKSNDGSVSSVLPVTQLGKNGLILSEKHMNVDCTEQTVELTLQYNVEYNVTISQPGWITSVNAPTQNALSSKTLYFKISANNDAKRTGCVYVTATDMSVSDTLTIEQAAFMPTLQIKSEKSYAFDSKAHTFTVSLNSNVDYSISAPSWVSYNGLKFSVEANPSENDRSGLIIFKGTKYSSVSDTISISQSGVNANIFKLTHSAKTFTIPTFSGASGKINWGDGSESVYQSGLSHTYSESGNHTVSVSLYNNSTVSMENLSKVSEIDLSSF